MNGSVHGRGRFTFIYCHLLTCLEPSIEFMYVCILYQKYIYSFCAEVFYIFYEIANTL